LNFNNPFLRRCLRKKSGGHTMFRNKPVSLSIIIIFIGLQCPFVAHAQIQETAENSLKMSKTNNQFVVTPETKFGFQPLPYAYDALEPYIDRHTIEIHYSKHHRAYYDNFLKAILGTELELMDIKDIFINISKYPVAVRNNGGGYFNHTFYWESMKANGSGLPSGALSAAITKTFGSIEEFKRQFSEAGKTLFGSGWVWLCLDKNDELFICSTPNQDNPLMDIADPSAEDPGLQSNPRRKSGIPLLAIDVWEHAYYLKYQNKRADYIQAFWNVVNWEEVARRYEIAVK